MGSDKVFRREDPWHLPGDQSLAGDRGEGEHRRKKGKRFKTHRMRAAPIVMDNGLDTDS